MRLVLPVSRTSPHPLLIGLRNLRPSVRVAPGVQHGGGGVGSRGCERPASRGTRRHGERFSVNGDVSDMSRYDRAGQLSVISVEGSAPHLTASLPEPRSESSLARHSHASRTDTEQPPKARHVTMFREYQDAKTRFAIKELKITLGGQTSKRARSPPRTQDADVDPTDAPWAPIHTQRSLPPRTRPPERRAQPASLAALLTSVSCPDVRRTGPSKGDVPARSITCFFFPLGTTLSSCHSSSSRTLRGLPCPEDAIRPPGRTGVSQLANGSPEDASESKKHKLVRSSWAEPSPGWGQARRAAAARPLRGSPQTSCRASLGPVSTPEPHVVCPGPRPLPLGPRPRQHFPYD